MAAGEKVALITGGGAGIGRAVALALATDGYSVVVAGRRSEPLEETVAAGTLEGSAMLAVTVDVRDPASVENLFSRTTDNFGRLDLLFNNAGVNSPPVAVEELTHEQWTSVVETNLSGAFLCAREAIKVMKSQTPHGGRIINNGSISAHAPRPNSAAYTATKHALTGLTKSLSLDCRKYDIACSQIDIGNALTGMTSQLQTGVLQANGRTESEPSIDVHHVAQAIVHIANLPLDVNVLFMTVMATKMPYVGRG